MASSVIQICNTALARVGVKEFIEDLAEGSAEADACSALYPTARDSALTSLPWPFATKRTTLALAAGEDEREGWEYVYAMPSDCLLARHIWSGERAPSATSKIPFTIELNDAEDARIILCDKEDAELVYTAAITNSLLFPPLFVDALCWLLASELALPLSVRTDLRTQAQQMWLTMQTRAAGLAFSEGHEITPTTPTIASRD